MLERARLGMTLEPLLGSTAPNRADVSWNTSSELSVLTAEDQRLAARRRPVMPLECRVLGYLAHTKQPSPLTTTIGP